MSFFTQRLMIGRVRSVLQELARFTKNPKYVRHSIQIVAAQSPLGIWISVLWILDMQLQDSATVAKLEKHPPTLLATT